MRAQGRALLRLDRGGERGTVGPATAAARAAIEWADALLVADYGRGVAAESGLRGALEHALAEPARRWCGTRIRAAPQPVGGAWLVTPNAAEAARLRGRDRRSRGRRAAPARRRRAEALRDRWAARWVCVTRGADGAVLGRRRRSLGGGRRATRVPVGDPCGAGDRFACAPPRCWPRAASVPEARARRRRSRVGVRGGGRRRVGRRPAPAPDRRRATDLGSCGDADHPDHAELLARVRARGGTVVATGGCFDLLHPGHVATLQAARALGDCLVVCLNSDRSVRRLKGPSRPIVVRRPTAAAVLWRLDASTPSQSSTRTRRTAVLRALRPDLWVKGGDYAAADLPEAAVLAEWGGRAVVLPFVEGRSTTRLIEEAAAACRLRDRAAVADPVGSRRSPSGPSIVTGGASGLGRAIADAVARAGGTPVVLDRDRARRRSRPRGRRPRRHGRGRGGRRCAWPSATATCAGSSPRPAPTRAAG